jgi:mannan endo-1,4-beta-mannosidase
MRDTAGKLYKQFAKWAAQNKPRAIGLLVAVVVGIIGLSAMALSGAATFVVSLEAESGTLSGSAAKLSAPTGASGDAVNFGTTTPPTPTPPTPTPPTPGTGYKAGFVYRSGTKLMLNGSEYKFAGFNAFGITGCHSGTADSQATLESLFSGLKPGSMVRLWAFQNYGTTALDRAVAAAEKTNTKLMMSLEDGAGGCGRSIGASFYNGGYKTDYYNWINTVVAKYKDSPAIGAWEIMNEPGQTGGLSSQSVAKTFYSDAAAKIKSVDPNHLVASGTLDSYQGWQSGQAGYADVHSSPNIDLVSMHEYEYYSLGNTGLAGRFNQNKAAAVSLNKPIYIGEFGLVPSNGCTTADQRASLAKGKFDAYFNNGAAGVLYWTLTNPGTTGSVCNSYDAKEAYNAPIVTMEKNYTNSNLPTPKL